jgi:hypothetical protein
MLLHVKDTLRRFGLASALFVLAGTTACRQRTDPAGLVRLLEGQGVHVDQGAILEPQPEWVGAMMGMDLVLDYEDSYRAIRFQSVDLARAYCQGAPHGVHMDEWCIETSTTSPREDTWQKVIRLR